MQEDRKGLAIGRRRGKGRKQDVRRKCSGFPPTEDKA